MRFYWFWSSIVSSTGGLEQQRRESERSAAEAASSRTDPPLARYGGAPLGQSSAAVVVRSSGSGYGLRVCTICRRSGMGLRLLGSVALSAIKLAADRVVMRFGSGRGRAVAASCGPVAESIGRGVTSLRGRLCVRRVALESSRSFAARVVALAGSTASLKGWGWVARIAEPGDPPHTQPLHHPNRGMIGGAA